MSYNQQHDNRPQQPFSHQEPGGRPLADANFEGHSTASENASTINTPSAAGLGNPGPTSTHTKDKPAGRPGVDDLPGPAPHTAGPHKSDLLNKIDPRVDSDMSKARSLNSYASAHPGTLPGPAPHTAGPHGSDLLNKLDPRVHSQGYPSNNPPHDSHRPEGQEGLPRHDDAGVHAGSQAPAGATAGHETHTQAPHHVRHPQGGDKGMTSHLGTTGDSIGAALRPHESELDRVRAGYPGTHVPVSEGGHSENYGANYGGNYGAGGQHTGHPQQHGHHLGGNPAGTHQDASLAHQNPGGFSGPSAPPGFERSNLGGSGLEGSRGAAGPAVPGGVQQGAPDHAGLGPQAETGHYANAGPPVEHLGGHQQGGPRFGGL